MKKYALLFLFCASLNGMENEHEEKIKMLFERVSENKLIDIHKLLEKNPDLINVYSEGNTLLTQALSIFRSNYLKRIPIILALIKKGADPNLRKKRTLETPLWLVISKICSSDQFLRKQTEKIIFKLIKKGADIRIADCDGFNPLHKLADRSAGGVHFNASFFEPIIAEFMTKLIKWYSKKGQIASLKEALTTKTTKSEEKTACELLGESQEKLKQLFDPTSKEFNTVVVEGESNCGS